METIICLANTPGSDKEISILAGLLGNGQRQLSSVIAAYILNLGFGEDQKARMHDLVTHNQGDALSPDEKEELIAFGKAGDALAILKSEARRALRTPRPIS